MEAEADHESWGRRWEGNGWKASGREDEAQAAAAQGAQDEGSAQDKYEHGGPLPDWPEEWAEELNKGQHIAREAG